MWCKGGSLKCLLTFLSSLLEEKVETHKEKKKQQQQQNYVVCFPYQMLLSGRDGTGDTVPVAAKPSRDLYKHIIVVNIRGNLALIRRARAMMHID